MKTKYWKYASRVLKFIALVVPLACLILFAQEHLFYFEDDNTRRIELFYEEEENSIDVVLMGASEVTNDFSPGYAYENYGYTSYMYTVDFNRGVTYLSQLKEILKHQDPQAIVVEVYGFLVPSTWDAYHEARFRLYAESIPFSLNKVTTVLEQPFEDKLSYLVPFVKYHGNLSEAQMRLGAIGEEKPELPDLKGMNSISSVLSEEGDAGDDFDPVTFELNEDVKKALAEFLEFCEEEGLENVMFVNFPRVYADENHNSTLEAAKKVDEILNQYGYKLLNLQNEKAQIGLDVARDFADAHHLNIYGTMKLTDYLCSKMVDEYQLVPMAQSAENQQKWEKCVSDTRVHFEMIDALINKGEEHWVTELTYAELSPAQILSAE